MGRHLHALQCSTDGRIDAAAWAAARAADAAERMSEPKPARVNLRVVALKPEAVIRAMARVITVAAVDRAHVHVRDFERAGVEETLARRYFAAAFARARLIEPALDTVAEA